MELALASEVMKARPVPRELTIFTASAATSVLTFVQQVASRHLMLTCEGLASNVLLAAQRNVSLVVSRAVMKSLTPLDDARHLIVKC